MAHIGEAGQLKLLQSKVLIIGAGGLGCPCSTYLCAAGVGTLTIYDDDQIRHSDLQRQFLYQYADIGLNKVGCAAKILSSMNPDTIVLPVFRRFEEADASEVDDHDLVIDCSDNFETRYLINRICAAKRKPLLSGASVFYAGQIFLYKPDEDKPCYQCLYPRAPASDLAPNCTSSSVFGPLTGVIGTMMAVEAVKQIVGIGETSGGTLISYDAFTTQMTKMSVAKNPACPACSAQGSTDLPEIAACSIKERKLS